MKDVGDVGDGARIGRHVLADLAVAARRRRDQPAVLRSAATATSPSIFGSAVIASSVSAASRRNRRMRATKSTTSSSANALSSDSIGTACAHLAEFLRDGRADPLRRRILAHQIGKALLDREIAPAQRIIVGIRNGRRILGVIAQVMAGDFFGQACELFRRLSFAQGFDWLVGQWHAGIPLALIGPMSRCSDGDSCFLTP